MMISDCGNYKKEGSHLYEDQGEYWLHVYQNARYSRDTDYNFKCLIKEYEETPMDIDDEYSY